jgi:LPS-assembly lipoprotein
MMPWNGKSLSVVVLMLFLAACGYRLQGSESLPAFMAVTYIDTVNPYSDLSLSFERSLRSSGMQPSRVPEGATAVLRVMRDEYGQRLLSVSATNVPKEFEVYYTVAYQVIVEGKVLLEVDSRTLTRDYTFDPTDVLAKRREEEFLRKALADDLVRLMMGRINTLELPVE